MALDSQILLLRRQISAAEAQLEGLKAQLAVLESPAEHDHRDGVIVGVNPLPHKSHADTAPLQTIPVLEKDASLSTTARARWPLTGEEFLRYGRTMIMKEHGLEGQLRLKNAKVLIVGCGGLGCPAAAYLAGAGVGTLGLMDGDTVELSNLHRQIAHSSDRVGMRKVDSAKVYLEAYVKIGTPRIDYHNSLIFI